MSTDVVARELGPVNSCHHVLREARAPPTDSGPTEKRTARNQTDRGQDLFGGRSAQGPEPRPGRSRRAVNVC
jgi:hypothetical protein